MGLLRCKTTNRLISLRAKTLFGRDTACDVHVDDPKVSAEHASLRWRDGAWLLRDLGSANGTYVGSRRLVQGERIQLELGATVSLGHAAAVFELVDIRPPAAAAVHRTTGFVHVATGGILVLPNEDDPQVTLWTASDGKWYLEIENEIRPAKNGQELVLGGDRYVIEVPTSMSTTVRSGHEDPLLESIRLRFTVAPDEESVEVTVLGGRQSMTVPRRRFHYLLLTLARAWLADTGVPHSVRGYRDRDELCKQLGTDMLKLNVEIFRLRRQFAELGIQGAAGIIERRQGTAEVRIGIHDVEVVTG